MNAFDAAAASGSADKLGRELGELFNAQNRGGHRTDIPAAFLEVVATKR